MPTYVFRCPACLDEGTFLRKVDDRDDTPLCEADGTKTDRVFTAAMVPRMGIADHYKIESGSGTFYGAGDYKKYLKANGLAPSSDLAGEVEHQKKQTEAKVKEQRRTELRKIVAEHT